MARNYALNTYLTIRLAHFWSHIGADVKADEVKQYRSMRWVSSSVSDVAWHASMMMAVRSHVLWCSLITCNVQRDA